ncbi:glycosyltransferase family 4 protein [Brochothrix campestris]|uniref:glycosyltransferase family 4 protein n=1 Tax=Brochothrix campestris TaxID=2757 RepID=UPI002FBE9898
MKKKRWLRIGYIFWQMTLVALKAPGDIVHSNDLNTLLQGVIIKKVTRTKLVYDSHEIQTSRTGYNSKWYEVVERKLLKHVDVYIHENITRANYIEQLYGRRPAVIHNYPTVTKNASKNNCNLYQLLNIPPEEPILLYQGGIQTGRGLDKLIEAVPLFNKGVLVLIGDGKMKLELVTRVKKEQLSDRIKFVEKVPLSDLPTYTKQAYLGFQVLNNVCYNHFSASSNKLFEYMMAGVPVIASRFPEMKRVVLTEKTGILVDSHSAKSIAQAVNLLIAHPEYRECLRNNALKASKRYNWEHESKQLLTVYKTIKS